MTIEINKQPKSTLELTVAIEPKEYEPHLKRAAARLASQNKIPGFRPGKAPYEIIVKNFGASAILEEALNDIISSFFIAAIEQKKLTTIGQPKIEVKKIAPANPLIFTAIVTTLPAVELADLSAISVTPKPANVTDKDVQKTLDFLAQSHATESIVDRPAQNQDMVKMNYTISIAGIPQDNGSQTDFEAYLGEKHMIPGFEDNIIGLKSGEEKTFTITFPENYFQPNFAGKECEFRVKIKGVYKITVPKINDAFAQSLGSFPNLGELKKQIQDRLQIEKETQGSQELERKIIDAIIAKSKFDELPDIMIDNEVESIILEFKRDLENHGLELNLWLQNMKKSIDEFKRDLRPQAESRVKGALVIRHLSEQEKIEATPEEVDHKIENLKALYPHHDHNHGHDDHGHNHDQERDDILKQFDTPSYRDHIANIIRGDKVIKWLKERVIED